jgi:hypothetical protein
MSESEHCDLHEIFHLLESAIDTSHLMLKFMYDRALAGVPLTPLELTALELTIGGVDRLSGPASTESAEGMVKSMLEHLVKH